MMEMGKMRENEEKYEVEEIASAAYISIGHIAGLYVVLNCFVWYYIVASNSKI